MQAEDARMLLDYNGWANRLLLSAACQLPPEEFDRDLRTSFGSIRGTLVHLLNSERVWLLNWQGKSRPVLVQPEDFVDAPALAAAFPALEGEQRTFFDGLTDEALRSRCRVNDRHYVLAHLVQHMMSHSQYHRGQVASLLRQLGHAPPNTGFRTGFLDERGLYETT